MRMLHYSKFINFSFDASNQCKETTACVVEILRLQKIKIGQIISICSINSVHFKQLNLWNLPKEPTIYAYDCLQQCLPVFNSCSEPLKAI